MYEVRDEFKGKLKKKLFDVLEKKDFESEWKMDFI
jgi:hypothetical protein